MIPYPNFTARTTERQLAELREAIIHLVEQLNALLAEQGKEG